MNREKYKAAGAKDVNGAGFFIENPSDYALGLEIDRGTCLHLVDKNMPLPVSVSRMFSPVAAGQKQVEIHIVQGKSRIVARNRSLSRFIFKDLQALENNESQIKISFQINSQGMFRVCVKNPVSGYEKKMIICRNPFSVKYQPYMEMYKLKKKAEQTMKMADKMKKHLKYSFLSEIREISENAEKAVNEWDFSLFSGLYVSLDVIQCELTVMAELKAETYAE